MDTQTANLLKALAKAKRHIEQLAETTNHLSNKLGLGDKVHAVDFYEHIDAAIAKVQS